MHCHPNIIKIKRKDVNSVTLIGKIMIPYLIQLFTVPNFQINATVEKAPHLRHEILIALIQVNTVYVNFIQDSN